MNEVLVGAIALLIYSGPLLPLAATLLFKKRSCQHFRRNRLLLIFLTSLQVLSFTPYVVAEITQNPDALHALFYPALLGVLLFTGTFIYLVCEWRYFVFEVRRSE